MAFLALPAVAVVIIAVPAPIAPDGACGLERLPVGRVRHGR